jgi:DNA-binding NtrC family response regulator
MKKILIVDDEAHLRLLYGIELRNAGYSVMTAANAKQCLEYVSSMKLDLVILDIRMPGMDGVEVLHRIIAHNTQLPVIINTAYSSCFNNYLTWAADACLVKSSNLGELLETVGDLLKDKGTRHTSAQPFMRRTSHLEKSTHVGQP